MDHLKELYWVALAGLSGAFASISLHKDKKSPVEIVIFIVSGCLTSAFVAPLFAKWMGLEGNEAISAVGFLTGACWNTVISRGSDYLKNIKVGGQSNG